MPSSFLLKLPRLIWPSRHHKDWMYKVLLEVPSSMQKLRRYQDYQWFHYDMLLTHSKRIGKWDRTDRTNTPSTADRKINLEFAHCIREKRRGNKTSEINSSRIWTWNLYRGYEEQPGIVIIGNNLDTSDSILRGYHTLTSRMRVKWLHGQVLQTRWAFHIELGQPL